MTNIADAQAVLRDAESANVPAHPLTRLALRMIALTAARPGELLGMEWREIGGSVWTIPAARMKSTRERAADVSDHHVPLSLQALDVLGEAANLSGGRYVFPSWSADRPLSENALGYLMNRAGWAGRQCAHGWRATFTTIMNELHPSDNAILDLMLAHAPKNAVNAAYNRAVHIPRRGELAQLWADLLNLGPASALIDLPRK